MSSQSPTAARRVTAQTPLDKLPLAVALRIFALLPADARLLAAAVCRSWRAMLADSALWTLLDLSPASGVANPSDALLHAAAARAGGQLEVLHVSLRRTDRHEALLAVLAANVGTLHELVLSTADKDDLPSSQTVAALLRAAPGLRLLEASVVCQGASALSVLRKEPPFGPLRLKRADFLLHYRRLSVDIGWSAVIDGLSVHNSLEVVKLADVWPGAQAESDALLGALLSLPLLRSLDLWHPPASVLARLLGCATLKSLRVYGGHAPLLDSPASAALLCNALRANTQLETLDFTAVDLWRDMDAAAALLATLQAHSSLRAVTLSLDGVRPEHAAAAGAALGALIAHSPALETLDITLCHLGDAGLGPIMDALPRARLLQTLKCRLSDISEATARERLLPAVRACASLRELKRNGNECVVFGFETEPGPAEREAQGLLQQRRLLL